MCRRKVKWLSLVIAGIIFLPGCFVRDIEDKNIITAVILDKKGDEYGLYEEIALIDSNAKSNVDASQSSSAYESSGFTFVETYGKTFAELRQKLDLQMDKPLYLDAVQTLIATESVIKEDLAEYLFRLSADGEYRQKVVTVMTREEPEALKQSKTENEISFGFAVDGMLDQLIEHGTIQVNSTAQCVDNMLSQSAFFIPCVDLQERNMIVSGYGAMGSDGTYKGFIPIEKANGLLFIRGEKAEVAYTVQLDDKRITIFVERNGKKITPSYENGSARFKIKLDFTATINNFSKGIKPLDETTEKKILDWLNEEIRNDVISIWDQAKEMNCDFLSFYDAFRINYPEEFKSMNWDDEYAKAQMEPDIQVNLISNPRMNYYPN